MNMIERTSSSFQIKSGREPEHRNIYGYNAEFYDPNIESQYLRARYYDVPNGNFLTEDSYLGDIKDPLSLNQYNYVKSSPPNYTDPSGHETDMHYLDRPDFLVNYLKDPNSGVPLSEDVIPD